MAKASTIKKVVKKKRVSKSDEKMLKDQEDRERGERGYDRDAERYGMKESVYDAKPKQKQSVQVSGYRSSEGLSKTYVTRGEKLSQDTSPAHREFARIRIGDTALKKKEGDFAASMKTRIKEGAEELQSRVIGGVIHINGKPVNHSSIEVGGVDHKDRPDFSDAYIARAEYQDGTELADHELDHLDQHHPDITNEKAHQSLQGMHESKGVPKKDENGSCWAGYTQYGMKLKKGKSRPNCVKDK